MPLQSCWWLVYSIQTRKFEGELSGTLAVREFAPRWSGRCREELPALHKHVLLWAPLKVLLAHRQPEAFVKRP